MALVADGLGQYRRASWRHEHVAASVPIGEATMCWSPSVATTASLCSVCTVLRCTPPCIVMSSGKGGRSSIYVGSPEDAQACAHIHELTRGLLQTWQCGTPNTDVLEDEENVTIDEHILIKGCPSLKVMPTLNQKNFTPRALKR